MSLETIEFNKKNYPKFQSIGNAMQFAQPYALNVCSGIGVDVGCNRLDWMFSGNLYRSNPDKYKDFNEWILDASNSTNPESYPIDPCINNYTASNFPENCNNLDFIISSHCLEHLENWVDVLNYWYEKLKSGGVLFLYLPDYSQEYWRPWNNRKHINIFTPDIINDWMIHKNFKNIFKSGVDLNNSFMIFAEK